MLASGLVEVGHAALSPDGLLRVLRQADRSALPAAAPPHGLYLAAVHYTGTPQRAQRSCGVLAARDSALCSCVCLAATRTIVRASCLSLRRCGLRGVCGRIPTDKVTGGGGSGGGPTG